jgi:hypothetical protein
MHHSNDILLYNYNIFQNSLRPNPPPEPIVVNLLPGAGNIEDYEDDWDLYDD